LREGERVEGSTDVTEITEAISERTIAAANLENYEGIASLWCVDAHAL
jgi:hypothetical protein